MARPVSMRDVKICGGFWGRVQGIVRDTVLPYQWQALDDRVEGAAESGALGNFRKAAGLEEGRHSGYCFQDSDVYKWLEAVAFTLMGGEDKDLEEKAEEAIALISKAQRDDGYLDTYYILNGLDKRFSDLRDSHELYCLGHLAEAGAAYFMATGRRKLLDAALGFIDLVSTLIGPEEGKMRGYPGHEELEMALMKVFRVTGEDKYRRLASYFINERGKKPLYFKKEGERPSRWEDGPLGYQYYQAGKPVREQDKAEGHAVRALYLCSGMADVALADNDQGLWEACLRLWDNITGRQMYITGAIGAQHYGESFSFDYNLPNDMAYGETCASIALVFFAQRLFLHTHDGKFMDVMERALYNSVLSGMSLDGTAFFYVNPLEVEREAVDKLGALMDTEYRRKKWFGCACCPPNLARLVSSIGEYAFCEDDGVLYINHYMNASLKRVCVSTDYPWDGRVEVTSTVSAVFTVALRIPIWSGSWALLLNGDAVTPPIEKGYAYITRRWSQGDKLILTLDMSVRVTEANPRVKADIGKAAVERGPLVYCLEEEDNGGVLHLLSLSPEPRFELSRDDALGGAVTITADGRRQLPWDDDALYRKAEAPRQRRVRLRFIPYYAWANRSPGDMTVWVRYR